MMDEIRTNYVLIQDIFYPDDKPFIRVNKVDFQYAYYQADAPDLRTNYALLQDAYYPLEKPKLSCNRAIIQYLVRAPETTMSNDVFPASYVPGSGGQSGLKGMTYGNKARPTFSSKIADHTSGRETATTYWENPKWEFELSFDWLPNQPGVNEDFRTLCGFFMSRRGRFDTFLFRAPDDHRCDDVVVGTGDGILAQWELFRPMGSFNELIGQVDTDHLDVYLSGPRDYVINTGPYTVTLHADTGPLTLVKIGATTMVDVSPASPAGSNQYKRVGDVLTFDASRSGQTVAVSGKVKLTLTTDYEVLMPRTISFVDAPPTGVDIIATFEFFFVCRFVEDMQDFEQFANRLWDLNEMTLRSVIQ
jgi:uncharacterized protein (TIGR02217 family)